MLNRRIFHPPLQCGRWLKFGLGIRIVTVTVTAMALSQVHAHDSPQHTIPATPTLDIIVNQLTIGVSSTLRYGPVRSGETLSSIARQHAPKNISRKQYMNMILQLNPQAFIHHNINKLKVKSVLILPSYQDNANMRHDASIAKQRTQFSEFTAFFPQVPIRVIAPNTLSQQQKQAKLQAQIQKTQQTVMHEQVSLLQQISQLEQQLSIRKKHVAKLNHDQQQLLLRNQNLLRQLQDLHVKYDHIINNYTVIPKF